ncbi:helix-turn-helix domain-containing protein [Bacillaceae bacterium S4-13-56]
MNPPIHIFLKFHRLKKGISQEEVCEGICSVSYYSKIENGQTVPSEEILSLLMERLHVSINIHDRSEEAKERLNSWYKQNIINFNSTSEDSHLELKEVMSDVFDPFLHNLFILYEFHYYLTKENYIKANELKEELENLKDIFNEVSLYFYHKFNGIFYYSYGDFHRSTQYFETAEVISKGGQIEHWEKADLCFHMARSYLNVYKVNKTFEYVNLALELYYEDMNYKRTAECQFILGVCYLRSGDLEKAEASFSLSEKAANVLGLRSLLKSISFYRGKFYTTKGDSEKALKFLLNGYEDVSGSRYSLNTVLQLVQELTKSNQWDDVKKWVDKGFSLIDDPSRLQDYIHHFTTYQKLSSGDFQEFKLYVTMKTIPFFQRYQLHEHVSNYSLLLAKELEKRRKYRDSSRYYKLSSQALSKLLHF